MPNLYEHSLWALHRKMIAPLKFVIFKGDGKDDGKDVEFVGKKLFGYSNFGGGG